MDLESLDNLIIYDSDSDDEMEIITITSMEAQRVEAESSSRSRRSSTQPRNFIRRDHFGGHRRVFLDYFADPPVFPPNIFRRRFRMNQSLFLRIHDEVLAHEQYFVQKRNSAGVLGLSSLQKITAAFRLLAYGVAADSIDEYLRIGESTALKSLKKFVKAVIAIFSDEYWRSPNQNDIARLLAIGESRGFPGMLGSIDCMHWTWKNCPTAWKGMYTGHAREPTIILEAVASSDLWIWHAFFGLPGSHNDINVLERSFVFSELAQGRAPPVNYIVNGNEYTMGYYLADGIYPQWATFVKTLPSPKGRKNKHFAAAQEAFRKDYEQSDKVPPIEVLHERTPEVMEFIQRHRRIRDRGTHSQLQEDLIEHLWQLHGDQ